MRINGIWLLCTDHEKPLLIFPTEITGNFADFPSQLANFYHFLQCINSDGKSENNFFSHQHAMHAERDIVLSIPSSVCPSVHCQCINEKDVTFLTVS